LVSLARRAYHFQQLASSSTPFHECRTYYLKSGISNKWTNNARHSDTIQNQCLSAHKTRVNSLLKNH
ncbi:hypothetical protein, partial [Vibrio crassostreae]|uniref:hypothetical protein n=1 Tax=Vibrio crassostreae TaxID=246167 RepID=UPI001A9EF474